MTLDTAEKQKLIESHQVHATDTGSVEVQVAMLSERISKLSDHLQGNIHDYASRQGLLKMIGKRKRLLSYIKSKNPKNYQDLIKKIGIKQKTSLKRLLFDKQNPSSVINCFAKARENIRLARTAVTLEVWNAINSSFYEFSTYASARYTTKNLLEIIDIVKRLVNTIRGTIVNTQLLNDGFDFLTVGTYFERSDFTARLIDVKYYILLPSSDYVGSANDQIQWGMLLRSISSYWAYNWAYGTNEYSYSRIIDFKKFKKFVARNRQSPEDAVEIDKPIMIGWYINDEGEQQLSLIHI